MKKTIIAAALVAAFTTTAQAAEVTGLNPYVGIDLAYHDVGYDNGLGALLDDDLWGGNIYAGIRPHMNWGVEAGYFRTRAGDKDLAPGFTSKVKTQGITLDLMGFAPVSADNRFELIGSAGGVYSKVDASAAGLSVDDKELNWRLGAGAQYHITDAVGFRAMAHYQNADYEDSADRIITYSVGVNYSF